MTGAPLVLGESGGGVLGLLAALILVAEWGIRITLVPVVVRKHEAAEALAWLGVILFLPIPGLVIYLMFGRGLLGRKRIASHSRAVEWVETPERLGVLTRFASPEDQIEPQHRDLARLAERVGFLPIVRGNDGEAYRSSQHMVDKLVEAIDGAEQHVHMIYYIFRDDSAGKRVAKALMRAGERGVACRVLVDSVGSKEMLRTLAPQMRKKGVEVREALPVRLFRHRLARIDVRNHRKLTIIDGAVAFTGSQNVADPDYGHKRIGAWHDLTVRVRGPVVYQLQMVFAEDWGAETGSFPDDATIFPEPELAGDTHVQAVPSGPGRRNQAFRNLVLSAINEADEHVTMVTPYFMPDAPSLLALKLRAMAGVRVDIIVPEKTNSVLVNAAAKSAFLDLLRVGTSIHLHRPGLLHVKAVAIDDKVAIFGSGNFDRRSFNLNYELNLLTLGPNVAFRLRNLLETYQKDSRPLTIEELESRSRVAQITSDVAKLVAPLL